MDNLTHGSFAVERLYDAAVARLYAAFADPGVKARWFAGPAGWQPIERTFDFRVGGREIAHGTFPGGPETRFVATYHEIVPQQRIVYAYDMFLDGRLLSVSLATVEFVDQGGHTLLRMTEQGIYYDGTDANEQRRAGTVFLCEQIAAHLAP